MRRSVILGSGLAVLIASGLSGGLRAQDPPAQAEPGKKGDSRLVPCGEATGFRARQAGEEVTITAEGSHRTGGFKVVFEQSPIRIFPPQFVLKHDAPSGAVPQVVTPFRAQARFKAGREAVREVSVHDAKGKHTVTVERGGSTGVGGEVTLIARAERGGGGGGDVKKPTMIDSAQELQKALPTLTKAFPKERDLEARLKKVDFARQALIFFDWSGSGGDELDHRVEGDQKPVVVFLFQRGVTKDLRTHDHLFAIPKGATWRVDEGPREPRPKP